MLSAALLLFAACGLLSVIVRVLFKVCRLLYSVFCFVRRCLWFVVCRALSAVCYLLVLVACWSVIALRCLRELFVVRCLCLLCDVGCWLFDVCSLLCVVCTLSFDFVCRRCSCSVACGLWFVVRRCFLFVVCCFLVFVDCCSLMVVRCLLIVVRCVLFVVCCLFLSFFCVLFVACGMLFGGRCYVLFVVCCVLSVVCASLFIVRCVLCLVSCLLFVVGYSLYLVVDCRCSMRVDCSLLYVVCRR